MADRTVTYTFRGSFANLTAGLATAGKGVQDLGVKLTALDRNGQKMRAGLTQLGSTAGTIGLVAAAGVAVAVRAAANFEQAMSNVQAATHETAANMEVLRQAALDAGQATKFSATEAAGAVEELAKAGVSTQDILGGGLSGALDLAAAGGLEVADAAQIAATALTQFRLAGEDVPHVADLLAAGAGKAQGDVSDLSMALKQSGLVAAQMGVSIEETTGTLAAFASAGLLGSDAGTSFRTLLLRLANPTKESAQLMKSLGIEAYDAQGNFAGLASVSGQLQTAFEGKTQAERDSALATLFGSDAIRAANVLYNQGASGIQDWTNKVDDQGYAAETAAIKMDNLKGDLEQLGGAFETALIGAGGGSQGPLRTLVQGATDVVNAFNKLPGPAQNTVTALAAITAITGGGLWFGAKVVGGISNTRKALEDLGVSANTSSRAMKGLGIAAGVATSLALVATAIRAINDAQRDALPGTQSLTEGLLDLTKTGEVAALGDQFADLGDDLDRLFAKSTDETIGDALFTPFKGILGNTADTQEAIDEIEALDAALANLATTKGASVAADALQSLADSGALSANQLAQLTTQLPQYDEALAGLRLSGDASAGSLNSLTGVLFGMPGALDSTAGATDGYAGATEGAGDAAADAAEDIAEMVQNMKDQKDAAVAAFDAQTAYRQAMKDAAAQAKESNAGIKGNSDEALKNRGALSGLISAWNSLDSTVTDNVGKFKAARDNFLATAAAMKVPKAEAERLWREMAKLPQSKVIPVSTPGVEDATNKARTLKQILDGLKSKSITVALHYQTIGNKPKAPTPGNPDGSADGGSVPKTGLPYADRHPYLLADGEEVISNRYGQADRFRADRAAGRIQGYADGGTIGGFNIYTRTDPRNRPDGDKDRKAKDPLSFFSSAITDSTTRVHDLNVGLKQFQKAADKATRAVERETEKRDAIASAMESLASGVAAGLRSNIFEKDDGEVNPWAASVAGSGVAGRNKTLQDDIAAGEMYSGLVETLKGRGLNGGALEALLAESDVDLLKEYATASQEDLASYQALFDRRDQTLAAAGQAAGDARYGAELAAQTKVLEKSEKHEQEANRRLNRIEAAIDRLDKHNQEGHNKTADETGKGKSAAPNARRKARRT